jgi:hypothetical protein
MTATWFITRGYGRLLMMLRLISGGCGTRRALGLTGALVVLLLAAAPLRGDSRKMIEGIRVETGVEGKVGVFFTLNGSFSPQCFSLLGVSRMLVCDFIDTALAPDVGQKIPVESELLLRIRTGWHVDPVKTRVVLDLDLAESYHIEQFFVQGKNEFVLVIQRLAKGAGL